MNYYEFNYSTMADLLNRVGRSAFNYLSGGYDVIFGFQLV